MKTQIHKAKANIMENIARIGDSWEKVELKITERPRHGSATGYGPKQPTGYMVKYLNRWRRVYCRVYGNAGTAYITAKGSDIIVHHVE
jgi:hypothetical protein